MADVFVLSAMEQEIHASVKLSNSNLSWFISSVYASPCIVKRRILWSNLSKVASLHSLPWLLLRDFNEILSEEDKFKGGNINLNRAIEFKKCINAYNLMDLGFSNPKYTWSNLRQILDLILDRIDRCFANPSWRLLYPEASVTHLPRVFLDHCPMPIDLVKPPLATQISRSDFKLCGSYIQNSPI